MKSFWCCFQNPTCELQTTPRVDRAGRCELTADLPQTLVAMITSNMSRAGHPSRVMVRMDSPAAEGSGLLMDSVIMTDNLATIHNSEIDRAIGSLSSMTEVDAALRTTLAL